MSIPSSSFNPKDKSNSISKEDYNYFINLLRSSKHKTTSNSSNQKQSTETNNHLIFSVSNTYSIFYNCSI